MRRLGRRLLREQQGASTVIVAICMTAVLIVLALVVDIGATAARKAQLQDAADAAAMALAQQCYEAAETRTEPGCAPEVQTDAASTATTVARATMNDGLADLAGVPDLVTSPERVTVSLTSAQAALFSWAAGSDGQVVVATATAEWRQTVALPFAVNSCILPDPVTTDRVFVGSGLYEGVSSLLGSALGLLSILSGGFNLPDYLEDVLNCGTNVLAGGWLGAAETDCTYKPNLVVSLTSTLNKILPLDDSCTDLIRSLIGKRVIVPVYSTSTIQGVGQLLGTAPITRFAEIIVSGYDFNGILNLSGVAQNDLSAYSTNPPGPSCAATLTALLGIEGTPAAALIDSILNPLAPLLTRLIELVDLCQGIQGQVVATGYDAAEAAERLVPYRLVT